MAPFLRAVLVPERNLLVAVAGWGMLPHGQGGFFSAAADRWLSLQPAGDVPSVRQDPSAIWDPIGRRLLMFGGDPGETTIDYNDTWALTLGG